MGTASVGTSATGAGTATGASTGASTGVSTGVATGASTGASTGVSTGASTGVSTGASTGTDASSTDTVNEECAHCVKLMTTTTSIVAVPAASKVVVPVTDVLGFLSK